MQLIKGISDTTWKIYTLEDKMSTINDVAKLAKVSKGTISRYLSGTLKIKEETVNRIEAAIKETNYIPNKTAAT